MEGQEDTRIIRFANRFANTRFAQFAFSNQTRVRTSIFIFILFTHALYWLSAWWSPLPYIIFNLVGFWFSQGIFKPWVIIISQAMQPSWDSAILKITVPFMVLNWVAMFACLYMFGTVVDSSSGDPIEGVWKHFYFSAVTLTTLGYGNFVPNDLWTEIIATIESLIGFFGFAVLAGVVVSIITNRVRLD